MEARMLLLDEQSGLPFTGDTTQAMTEIRPSHVPDELYPGPDGGVSMAGRLCDCASVGPRGNHQSFQSHFTTLPANQEPFGWPAENRSLCTAGPTAASALARRTADWPSLPRHLHLEALRILRAEGVSSLIRRGGQRLENGLLTFNRASARAQEIACRILSHSPGFWDVDDSGTQWVVCPHSDLQETGPWPGWAIALDTKIEWAHSLMGQPSGHLAEDRSAEWFPTLQSLRQAAAVRLKMQDLERALHWAGMLAASADCEGECIILPDNAGRSGSPESISLVGELVDSLSELSRLSIGLINLRPDNEVGWLRRRSSIVIQFEVFDRERVWVKISPDLVPVLRKFCESHTSGQP